MDWRQGLVGLFTILGALAALVVVPEVRQLVGLDRRNSTSAHVVSPTTITTTPSPDTTQATNPLQEHRPFELPFDTELWIKLDEDLRSDVSGEQHTLLFSAVLAQSLNAGKRQVARESREGVSGVGTAVPRSAASPARLELALTNLETMYANTKISTRVEIFAAADPGEPMVLPKGAVIKFHLSRPAFINH